MMSVNKRAKGDDGDTIMTEGSGHEEREISDAQRQLILTMKQMSLPLIGPSPQTVDDAPVNNEVLAFKPLPFATDAPVIKEVLAFRPRTLHTKPVTKSINPLPQNTTSEIQEAPKEPEKEKEQQDKPEKEEEEAKNPPTPKSQWAVYVLKFILVHILGNMIPLLWTVVYPFCNNLRQRYFPNTPDFFSGWGRYAKRVAVFVMDFAKNFLETESGMRLKTTCVDFWDQHGNLICEVIIRLVSTLTQQYVFFYLFLQHIKCVQETTEVKNGLTDDLSTRRLMAITTYSHEPVKLTRTAFLVNFVVWPLNLLVIVYPPLEGLLWAWLCLFPVFGSLNLLGHLSNMSCNRRNLQIVMRVDFWSYFFGWLFTLF